MVDIQAASWVDIFSNVHVHLHRDKDKTEYLTQADSPNNLTLAGKKKQEKKKKLSPLELGN